MNNSNELFSTNPKKVISATKTIAIVLSAIAIVVVTTFLIVSTVMALNTDNEKLFLYAIVISMIFTFISLAIIWFIWVIASMLYNIARNTEKSPTETTENAKTETQNRQIESQKADAENQQTENQNTITDLEHNKEFLDMSCDEKHVYLSRLLQTKKITEKEFWKYVDKYE